MAVNIQVSTTDLVAILYFQDGSSMIVEENSSQSIQLVEGGICTVSEALTDEDEDGLSFAEKMIKFWQTMAATFKGTTQRRDYKKREGDDGYGDEPP